MKPTKPSETSGIVFDGCSSEITSSSCELIFLEFELMKGPAFEMTSKDSSQLAFLCIN